MIDKEQFHISLESPQCGFMALAVWGGGAEVRYGAAHAPYDSLGDLLRGVAALREGAETLTVKWNTEPEEYDWHLRKCGEAVELKIVRYPDHRRAAGESSEIFAYKVPLPELCRVVEAEVRELQARAERDVFESNWRRPFPVAELSALAAAQA
jgi:hypothetical protein